MREISKAVIENKGEENRIYVLGNCNTRSKNTFSKLFNIPDYVKEMIKEQRGVIISNESTGGITFENMSDELTFKCKQFFKLN